MYDFSTRSGAFSRFSRSLTSVAASCTRRPTIIAVRDATVGPESGTSEVSCGARMTLSNPTPNASAAS